MSFLSVDDAGTKTLIEGDADGVEDEEYFASSPTSDEATLPAQLEEAEEDEEDAAIPKCGILGYSGATVEATVECALSD